MQPILGKLREKFPDKRNVGFVHVRKNPIMGARFGIRLIPVQVLFAKSGREVFRHTGLYSETEVLKQLTNMGVE